MGAQRRVSEAGGTGSQAGNRRGRVRGQRRPGPAGSEAVAGSPLLLGRPRSNKAPERVGCGKEMDSGRDVSRGPPSPTLCRSPPLGRRQPKDRGAAVPPKSETTRPPTPSFPSWQGHQEHLVLRGSRSLSFPGGAAGDPGFHPPHSARLKASISALPSSGDQTQRSSVGRGARPRARGAVTRSATAPSAHPNSMDPLRQPGTRARAPPGPSRAQES